MRQRAVGPEHHEPCLSLPRSTWPMCVAFSPARTRNMQAHGGAMGLHVAGLWPLEEAPKEQLHHEGLRPCHPAPSAKTDPTIIKMIHGPSMAHEEELLDAFALMRPGQAHPQGVNRGTCTSPSGAGTPSLPQVPRCTTSLGPSLVVPLEPSMGVTQRRG